MGCPFRTPIPQPDVIREAEKTKSRRNVKKIIDYGQIKTRATLSHRSDLRFFDSAKRLERASLMSQEQREADRSEPEPADHFHRRDVPFRIIMEPPIGMPASMTTRRSKRLSMQLTIAIPLFSLSTSGRGRELSPVRRPGAARKASPLQAGPAIRSRGTRKCTGCAISFVI
jgi:hypothetical protein